MHIRAMALILGLESSCDETAAALVTSDRRILAHRLATQEDAHRAFGGVVPEIAARAHVEVMTPLVAAALEEAEIGLEDVDAIAATAGPGLIGGVMVGLVTGKALAHAAGKPLVAVNHLEGHALSPRLTDATLDFPYLLLLVSGGHCQLLLVGGVGGYRRLATTIDDALGEAFDKTAKALGLGFPGGPAVEAAASRGDPAAVSLPRPLLGSAEPHFSFAGLKSAVLRARDGGNHDADDIAASFQQAAIDCLVDRTTRAIDDAGDVKALVVAGGVASNAAIRAALSAFAGEHGLPFIAPPPWLCTDNAAMIAWAGVERFAAGLTDPLDMPARARWPLDADAKGRARCGSKSMKRIGVIGGGAWGTALAQNAAAGGEPVTLWAREGEVVRAINETNGNPFFLPDIPLSRSIRATSDLDDLDECDAILVVAPAQHVRATLERASFGFAPLVLCAKGIEAGSKLLMNEVAVQAYPGSPIAVLSGPTFAHEVAAGLPSAVTLACEDEELGQRLAERLSRPTFRPYLSTDVIGAEIGGAVKNVLAIACGVVEGLGLGQNARAALISRGFAEMTRFGLARGAEPETLAGLSGLGDLVLTCSSTSSRNFSLGKGLGEGRSAAELLDDRATVAEGAFTAPVLREAAADAGVEMPITDAVAAVLEGKLSVREAIDGLLARPLKSEV